MYWDWLTVSAASKLFKVVSVVTHEESFPFIYSVNELRYTTTPLIIYECVCNMRPFRTVLIGLTMFICSLLTKTK